MESMEVQLQKIEAKIQEHHTAQEQLVAEFREFRSSEDKSHNKIFVSIEKLERQVALNLSEVHNRNQEKVQTALHKLDQDVDKVYNITRQIMNALPQLHQLTDIRKKQEYVASAADYNSVVTPTEVPQLLTTTTTTPKSKQTLFSSCKDVPSKASGTYLIRMKNNSEPFKVYCEQNAFDGGWIVMQYRYDGSLDFYRGWNEFRDGFGDLNKEFWLGLEKVHQITSSRKHELIVELKDFEGNYKYARYDAFEIGSESTQYELKDLGNYNGTVGRAMYSNKDEKFSTKDRDNDERSDIHCAQEYEGAWWHWRYCTNANLNGRYINAIDDKSMHWYYLKNNRQGLSYSRMMIRELE
ncbi:fibrinogen-like protein A [Anopheles darlingi]|uniref:fibrinogen-like protein A n=1 Tax=Anopheles darlingi TaxID=43151 RepID=UPI002100676E|nr:fibrinogen-like protein A [Anopheles darlingi]